MCIVKGMYALLGISLLQVGCRDAATGGGGIQGVYVTQTSNAYSMTWDTIYISAISKKGGTYFINHKAGYQRIRKGKRQVKEHKETRLIGNWLEDSRQLKTEKLGRVYSFPEDGQMLLMGTLPYVKIH